MTPPRVTYQSLHDATYSYRADLSKGMCVTLDTSKINTSIVRTSIHFDTIEGVVKPVPQSDRKCYAASSAKSSRFSGSIEYLISGAANLKSWIGFLLSYSRRRMLEGRGIR